MSLLLFNEQNRAAAAARTKSLCEKRYHDRAFAYNTTIKLKNDEQENCKITTRRRILPVLLVSPVQCDDRAQTAVVVEKIMVRGVIYQWGWERQFVRHG